MLYTDGCGEQSIPLLSSIWASTVGGWQLEPGGRLQDSSSQSHLIYQDTGGPASFLFCESPGPCRHESLSPPVAAIRR